MRHSHERELLRARNENASSSEEQKCRYGWEKVQSHSTLADIFKLACAARNEPLKAGLTLDGLDTLPNVDASLAPYVLPVAESRSCLEDVASIAGLESDAKEHKLFCLKQDIGRGLVVSAVSISRESVGLH